VIAQPFSFTDNGAILTLRYQAVLRATTRLALVAVVVSGGGCAATTPTSPALSALPPVPSASALTIGELPPTVTVGQSIQLIATVTLPDGAEKQVLDPTWHSSNVHVATISPTGLMTVVGNGTADVSASAYGHSASAPLRALSQIIGVVHETAPTEHIVIPEATVTIRGGTDDGVTTTTDANGQFVLHTMGTGGFAIIVTKTGYDPFTFEIVQLPRQHLTFAVAPTAIVHRWRKALPDFDGLGGHWGSDEIEIEVLREERPASMTLFGTCRTDGTYEKFSAYLWKFGADETRRTALLLGDIGVGPQTVKGILPKGRFILKVYWRALFDECELAVDLRHF
jgi:hypothetical protein